MPWLPLKSCPAAGFEGSMASSHLGHILTLWVTVIYLLHGVGSESLIAL